MDQVGSDPGSTGGERVTEGCRNGTQDQSSSLGRTPKRQLTDSASEDVGFIVRQTKLLLHREPLSSERLVDVEELRGEKLLSNDGGRKRAILLTSMSSILSEAFSSAPLIASTGPIPARAREERVSQEGPLVGDGMLKSSPMMVGSTATTW